MGLPGILLGCDGEQPLWDLGQVIQASNLWKTLLLCFSMDKPAARLLLSNNPPPPHLAQEAKISINSKWQHLGNYGLAPNSTSSEDIGC